MKERAEILRRKIAHYRQRLSEGIDADLARQYLREILEAETELARIDRETDRGQ